MALSEVNIMLDVIYLSVCELQGGVWCGVRRGVRLGGVEVQDIVQYRSHASLDIHTHAVCCVSHRVELKYISYFSCDAGIPK